jgi:deoxyribose-phosphate aldolase
METDLHGIARRAAARALAEHGLKTPEDLGVEALDRLPVRPRGRAVVTASDLDGLPDGGTLELPEGAELTALAREVAERRGLQLRASRPGTLERLRIAVGSDHTGFALKRDVLAWVSEMGHATVDFGTRDERAVDCADLAGAVAEAVARSQCQLGIVIDGEGIASAIAANKVSGARAATCCDAEMARGAREHSFANVLALGARGLSRSRAQEILRAFLTTAPGERHARAVGKIGELERSHVRIGAEAVRRRGGARVMAQGEALGAAKLEEILVALARQVLERGGDAVHARNSDARDVTIGLEQVRCALQAGACRVGLEACRPRDLGDLASYIDHTLLRADATPEEIDRLCAEALEHRFASVCVNGVHVKRCAEVLRGSGVLVASVAGFPLGAMASEAKVFEARRVVEDGACEVDMVMSIGLLKSGEDERVERDIADVVETCHALGARVKVILETCLLGREEKVRACRIAQRAGADFVKTSTGFAGGGATVEDVALMRETVGPEVGVKASGNVRDRETALALLAAGATRIGASASVAIVSG